MLFSSLNAQGNAALNAPVSWRDGVHIELAEGQSLWCDAARQRDLCFIGSAQGLRQLRLSDSLLCSERSWRLFVELLGADRPPLKPPSLLLSPPGRPFQLGPLRLELFSSGQLAGATSLWLRTGSGTEIVYAGAPNPAPRQTAEAMQVRAADTLIVHAPLAAVSATLPSRAAAVATLREHIAAAQHSGQATIVLCAALSTAPELLHALRAEPEAGPAPSLFAHPQILRACTAYRRIGALPDHLPANAPSLRRFAGTLPQGGVLFWPLLSSVAPLAQLAQSGKSGAAGLRILLCSAAALLSAFTQPLIVQLQAQHLALHEALPFPDAIDQPGLLRYVRDTGCQRVFLTAGHSEALAAALAPVPCFALGPPSQLSLFA